MTTPHQPQTVQQRVFGVIQLAATTRTPGMTPREIQARYRTTYGNDLDMNSIKAHIHTLTTAGQLVRMARRACTVESNHQPAQQVRAATATA